MVKPRVLSPAPQTTGLIINPRNPTHHWGGGGRKTTRSGHSLLHIELRLVLHEALASWGVSPSVVMYLTITEVSEARRTYCTVFFGRLPPNHVLIYSWQDISLEPLSPGQLWPRTPDCVTVSPSQPSRSYGLFYEYKENLAIILYSFPWPFLSCVTSTLWA